MKGYVTDSESRKAICCSLVIGWSLGVGITLIWLGFVGVLQ